MSARIELAVAGARIALTVEADPTATRRALVHAGGCAVAHVGALPAGPIGAQVVALVRGLVDAPVDTPDALVARLIARARAAGLAATIVTAPTLPRWSSRLRTGQPVLARGLWPFDPELAGLRRGLRRVLKRECFTDDAAAADRAWLNAAGLTVVGIGTVEPDGRRVMFATDDETALTPALGDAEAALRRGPDADAARVLGAALGYPPCCVDAFVAATGHDDRALVAGLDGATRASPLTVWLNQPLALVSHVPCTLACAATRDLAAEILDELETGTPGFAAAWRALAARLHVLDHRGRGLALVGDGALATGFTITDAVAFAPDLDDALGSIAAPLPDAVGRTITAADVVAAADHRGA